MNKVDVSQVLLKILDHTPEVKLRAGKQYAHGRTEPGGLISVAALKDRMRVSFITEGRDSDITADEFLGWVNDSGIMSIKPFGDTGFLLREGAKNTDKREVCAEITYEARTEDDIVTDTVAAYNALLEKLSGFFEPKFNNTASSNEHNGEGQSEPRKIGLSFRYENGDTGETFEEGGYTVDSDSAELQGSLNDWLERRDEESLKRFAIDLIGDPIENECETHGTAFEELLKVFFWRGADKLGWHEITVTITEIAVDGEELELSEIEEATLAEDCRVQLVRDANPTMYMIDCAL